MAFRDHRRNGICIKAVAQTKEDRGNKADNIHLCQGKRSVALWLLDWRKTTAKVDQSVVGFDRLKVGDSIHARYTEDMAILV